MHQIMCWIQKYVHFHLKRHAKSVTFNLLLDVAETSNEVDVSTCNKLLLEGTVTDDVDSTFNKRKISVPTNHASYVHIAG